jgi:hypothetical protein
MVKLDALPFSYYSTGNVICQAFCEVCLQTVIRGGVGVWFGDSYVVSE